MTFVIGLLAGVCIAYQSVINARLRLHLGFAFLTSFVSFAVGLIFLVAYRLGLAVRFGLIRQHCRRYFGGLGVAAYSEQ